MLHTKACEVCTRSFSATRDDARTCSNACRLRAHRTRQKARAERLAAEIAATTALLAALSARASLSPED